VTSAFNISLPNIEKFFDGGLIGSGNEYALSSTNDYISHPSISISDRINTELAAMLFKRALGGTVTNTVVTAAKTWDHSFVPEPGSDDPALPSMTVAAKLGGI